MPATREELRRIASLKLLLKRTDDQVADEMMVDPRTIRKWTASSEYREIMAQVRAEWREVARTRVAGLANDVLDTLHDLMMYSKQDRVRMQSAEILGRWMGLDEPEERKSGDDKNEAMQLLLKQMQGQQPQISVFAPPGPGGALPAPAVDAEIVDPEQN